MTNTQESNLKGENDSRYGAVHAQGRPYALT